MDPKSLETLESKISLVLEKVHTLQTEKLELERLVDELQSRYDDAARQVEELTREREVLSRNQRNVEQEELIRSKISALLAKLETA